MKSYFFVPASKLNKIESVKSSGVNEIIIDFEDAVLKSKKQQYIEDLKKVSNIGGYWFRIPIREIYEKELDFEFITELNNLGANKIILPKLKSASELELILEDFGRNKFIILIEHPRIFVEIQSFFQNNPDSIGPICGIGLGSHDLMAFLKAEHKEQLLDYPRKQLLYTAKAYGLEAIDIASMNIFKKEDFFSEMEYAYNNGYDGKFLIHPIQIEWLKSFLRTNTKLYDWAKRIISHLPKDFDGESIEPFILDSEVIEKPHVIRALEIIKTHKNEE